MPESYYRTGQAAKKLGVSSYHVRRLCEAGEIAAEITGGGQWRISLVEIRRLRKEGVPPVPQELPEEADEITDGPPVFEDEEGSDESEPAAEVKAAANAVKIAGSHLAKRRLEREAEEVEDWFRDRTQRETAAQVAERARIETVQAECRRREWAENWTEYALNSIPSRAPRETELEVHGAVVQTLALLQPSQAETTTRRLVVAAVEKALTPWRRTQQRREAVERALNQLAWDVRYRPEFAPLKLRALELAAAAVTRCRTDASLDELELAAAQSLQPIVREYDHRKACQSLQAWINLPGATWEELERAKGIVCKALSAQPVGTSQKQLEDAKQSALAPFAAKIAQRVESERAETEELKAHRAAGWKVDARLGHVEVYLRSEYEFDGGAVAMHQEAARVRAAIREELIEELMDEPEMTREDIDERIEELIDDGI